MAASKSAPVWEPVIDVGNGRDVRRLAVPGGWLYQVELSTWQTNSMGEEPDYKHEGYHPPVFVPDPEAR